MKKLIKILFLLSNFAAFYTIAMEYEVSRSEIYKEPNSKLYKFFNIEQIQGLPEEIKCFIAQEYDQWWYNLTTIENLIVNSAKFNPNGDKVLIGTYNKAGLIELRLFDLLGNLLGVSDFSYIGNLNISAFDLKNQYIATVSNIDDSRHERGSIVNLWDLNFNFIKSLQTKNKIFALAFNPQGQIVILARTSRNYITVTWYDINFHIIKKIKKECKGIYFLEKLGKDADKVLFQLKKQHVLRKPGEEQDCLKYLGLKWDFDEQEESVEFSLPLQNKNLHSAMVFAPEWNKVLTAHLDGTAKLWDLNGKNLATFRHIDSSLLANNIASIGRLFLPSANLLEFSPNGKLILTASSSCGKTVKLWDLNGKNLVNFRHCERIHNIAFNPQENIIMIGSLHQVKLWTQYKNPTLEQILLRKLIHLYLQAQKPSKKIESPEMLLKAIVDEYKTQDFEFDEEELKQIWDTIPEKVRDSFWRQILRTIIKFGK